jgi:hypothetical protein
VRPVFCRIIAKPARAIQRNLRVASDPGRLWPSSHEAQRVRGGGVKYIFVSDDGLEGFSAMNLARLKIP